VLVHYSSYKFIYTDLPACPDMSFGSPHYRKMPRSFCRNSSVTPKRLPQGAVCQVEVGTGLDKNSDTGENVCIHAGCARAGNCKIDERREAAFFGTADPIRISSKPQKKLSGSCKLVCNGLCKRRPAKRIQFVDHTFDHRVILFEGR